MGDDKKDTEKTVRGADGTAGTERQRPDGGNGQEEGMLTEFGFSTFVLSLSTSALVYLGELPDLTTNAMEVNLPLAKQTISLIEMLKEKTKGNLAGEEESLMDQVVYDLRVKYVKASKK